MNTARQLLKDAVLLLCAAVLVVVFIFVADVDTLMVGQKDKLAVLITKIDNNLDETHRVLLEAGLTAKEARDASTMEVKALPALTTGVQSAINNVNAAAINLTALEDNLRDTSVAASGTLNQATATVKQVGDSATGAINSGQKTVDALAPVEAQMLLASQNLNITITNPNIPKLLANSERVTDNFATMTHDGIVEEQKFVYPAPTPWYKQWAMFILRGGELAYDFIR